MDIDDAVKIFIDAYDKMVVDPYFNNSGFAEVDELVSSNDISDIELFCNKLKQARDYIVDIVIFRYGEEMKHYKIRAYIVFNEVAKRCWTCKHRKFDNPNPGHITLLCGLTAVKIDHWGGHEWEVGIPPETCNRKELREEEFKKAGN
jgi:hypothetical protein